MNPLYYIVTSVCLALLCGFVLRSNCAPLSITVDNECIVSDSTVSLKTAVYSRLSVTFHAHTPCNEKINPTAGNAVVLDVMCNNSVCYAIAMLIITFVFIYSGCTARRQFQSVLSGQSILVMYQGRLHIADKEQWMQLS